MSNRSSGGSRRDVLMECVHQPRCPDEYRHHIENIVDDAPPISEMSYRQVDRLRTLLSNGKSQDFPARPVTGRTINPVNGTIYRPAMRAADGTCEICHRTGARDVDHCHEHGIVRGFLCRSCNGRIREDAEWDPWMKQCQFCAFVRLWSTGSPVITNIADLVKRHLATNLPAAPGPLATKGTDQ
jgi:hypothetical protein